MVNKSKIESDVTIEMEKLKKKNMSVQEMVDFVNENYLTEGCDNEYVKPCGMICTYPHGCSYKMHYQKDEKYCMKNW